MATRGNGATTVSATMIFAHMVTTLLFAFLEDTETSPTHTHTASVERKNMCFLLNDEDVKLSSYLSTIFCSFLKCITLQVGIPLFVTGGIGGVHQHGENSKSVLCTY